MAANGKASRPAYPESTRSHQVPPPAPSGSAAAAGVVHAAAGGCRTMAQRTRPSPATGWATIELGSVPTPPQKPKSSMRTQSARPSTTRAPIAGQRSRRRRPPAGPGRWRPAPTPRRGSPPSRAPRRRRRTTTPPRPASEAAAWSTSARPWRPASPGWRPSPLPEAPPGPRLQDRHPEQEAPAEPVTTRPSSRPRPRPVGEGHQAAGDGVEEHGTGGTEQHGEAGGEDAAEGLAERPDHQRPPDAGQAGDARPPSPGRHQQEQADPQLDPHRRGRRFGRVVGPWSGDADVDQLCTQPGEPVAAGRSTAWACPAPFPTAPEGGRRRPTGSRNRCAEFAGRGPQVRGQGGPRSPSTDPRPRPACTGRCAGSSKPPPGPRPPAPTPAADGAVRCGTRR